MCGVLGKAGIGEIYLGQGVVLFGVETSVCPEPYPGYLCLN
jgi:hypothetical protein